MGTGITAVTAETLVVPVLLILNSAPEASADLNVDRRMYSVWPSPIKLNPGVVVNVEKLQDDSV